MVRFGNIILITIAILVSCGPGKQEHYKKDRSPHIIPATSFTIFTDSAGTGKPKGMAAGEPLTTPVGKIVEKQLKSNVIPAKPAKEIQFGPPVIKLFGVDGVAHPLKVSASDSAVYCKAPQVVAVKDSYIKDVNPFNFSSFSKLQGLRHDQIRSMILDDSDNLWLGTDDGLTRYDGKFFWHYTQEQGLNNNLILAVLGDSKNNIWFGTFRGGVTRYDGKFLTNFTTDNGLPNNVVNIIFEDNLGNIWFGTGGGAAKYDGESFTHYTTEQGLASNDVRAVSQDREGNIWIGTYDGGISVIKGVSIWNYDNYGALIINSISKIYKDSEDILWICTSNNGVFRYDGKSLKSLTTNEGLSSNNIREIYSDSEGKIWIGTTDSGLIKYDGKLFTNYTMEHGLGSNYIRTILEDKNGVMWMGTRGAGLTRFDGKLFTHLTTQDGLSNNRVMSIMEDNKGSLWFGTFGGFVTVSSSRIVDGIEQRSFSNFGWEHGLLGTRVYTIEQDKDGQIWIGTDGGGVSVYNGTSVKRYTTEQGLANDIIRDIFIDDDIIWIATYGSGVSKFDGNYFTTYNTTNGLSAPNVLVIFKDSKGNMWFGTDGGGVTLYDGINYKHYNRKSGFFTDIVNTIIEDSAGNIWMGSAGQGIIKFDGEYFYRYSDEHGLNNNHVLSIMQDNDGDIIAGARFGISILSSRDIADSAIEQGKVYFKSYNYEDGFIGIGCNLSAILQDSQGTIWIGTNDRLTRFKKESANRVYSPSGLFLSNLQIFNENVPWEDFSSGGNGSVLLPNGIKLKNIKFSQISPWYRIPQDLVLPYRFNYITLNYIAVTHRQVNKLKYRYILEGLSNAWSSPTDKTEVSFGNLRPGKYVFRLSATNSDGVKSDEISYSFTIKPPWYRTWFFYFASLFAILFTLARIIIKREEKIKAQKELLESKVREKTEELMVKNVELELLNNEKDKLFSIIAHDLKGPFNGFLGLTQLMAQGVEDMSPEEISDISNTLNASAKNLYGLLENLLEWSRLRQSLSQFNPTPLLLKPVIDETLDLVKNNALKKEIEIVSRVPDSVHIFSDKYMLQTILRNLLTNAIKFTKRLGKIEINANVKGKFIEICISDNGIGMAPKMVDDLFKIGTKNSRAGTDGESSTGLGLIICKELIEKMEGQLTVSSKEGVGSDFCFKIPLKKNEQT